MLKNFARAQSAIESAKSNERFGLVGGWSTPEIGRFYSGRHHTTVLYAIEKVERLRKQEPSIDALLEVLSGDLRPAGGCDSPSRPLAGSNKFIDAVVDRILHRLMSDQAFPRELNKLAEDFGFNSKRRVASPATVPPTADFARPKSRILIFHSRVIRMLSGFKSRWTIPATCAPGEAFAYLHRHVEKFARGAGR